MINRVDGQHNYTNPYERQKRKSGRVEADAPAFLLDYDEKGVVWERSSEQQKGQVPKDSVSSQGKHEEDKKKKPAPEIEKTAEPAEEIRVLPKDFFRNVLKRLSKLVQGFLQLVWYSGDEEKKAAEEPGTETSETELSQTGDAVVPVTEETAEDAEASRELTEEEEDQKLRELIAKKDNKAFMEVLTRGNRRRPARNTSILTGYDRRGRLVKPDDADAGRLLQHEAGKDRNGVTVRKQGTYRKYI